MKKIMYFYFLIFLQDVSAGLFGKRVVKIDVLKECDDYPDYQNLPMRYVNVSLITDATRKTLINTTLIVSKDINDSQRGSVKLYRCKNRESPDTCDLFTTLKLPNFIAAFNIKGQFWSPFTNNIEPPMKNVPEKGVYRLENGYFDADATPFPVPERTYWRGKIESYIKNDLISCFYMEGCLIKMK